MKKIILYLTFCLVLTACTGVDVNINTVQSLPTAIQTITQSPNITATFTPPHTPSPTPSVRAYQIPAFDHIIMMVLENQSYDSVIGSSHMPHLNALASQNVLLTNYFAVRHPSLPNYIALISGGTQNITSDCTDCFINQPNLADEIEAGGRTWKAYLEDMPSPCFVGNAGRYFQKHNPFIYFDSIRLDTTRCNRDIVPMTQLESDLSSNQLPNFAYIMANICNSGHDCSPETTDNWVNNMVSSLQASPAFGENSLIIITFDEADKSDTGSCCGLGSSAGGQVATILISPLAKKGFKDNTAYSHYSTLKTILGAWNLPGLGATQQAATQAIEAPWIGAQDSPQAPTTNTPPTPVPVPSTSIPTTPEISTTTPSSAGGQLTFPVRAVFYYPWFPQSWNQSGMNPFTRYHPTLGFYGQDDPTIIQQQIAAMQYGKIQLGIASWWGQGHYTDAHIPELLQAGEKAHFFWALYVESEGYGDPSVNSIQSDLQYVHDHYANSPAYLKINGHFVIFVYADKNDGCGMVDRWKQANNVGAYLVLKVFPGYHNCADQPNAWHQYAPALSQKAVGKDSFVVSPGFWKADEQQPRLVRNLEQWNSAIQAMIASRAKFQLISTFNEWGEGTAIESADEWKSVSGYGAYLDALHNDGMASSASNNPLSAILASQSSIRDKCLQVVSIFAAQRKSFVNNVKPIRGIKKVDLFQEIGTILWQRLTGSNGNQKVPICPATN